MLAIRFRRIGKKSHPTYRIVVAEHSNAVNGQFVVDLGFYNPHSKQFSINKEAVIGWMNKGAKPSNTVARLLEKEKVNHKSIIVVKYQKAPKKKVEENPPSAPSGGGAQLTTKLAAVEESTNSPADASPEESVKEETLVEATEIASTGKTSIETAA